MEIPPPSQWAQTFADTNHTAKDSSVGSRCWDGGRKLYFKLRQINFCEFQPFWCFQTHLIAPLSQPHKPGDTVQQLLYQETKDFADLSGEHESAEIHTEIHENERSSCISFLPPQGSFLRVWAATLSSSNTVFIVFSLPLDLKSQGRRD